MSSKLLTRDEFRARVFARDKHKCVFCDLPAKDAHHILERRLWTDGGYYLDNGASVCQEHHLACERTDISCQDVRHAAKITQIILPSHLYDDQEYDKWGNPILASGQRLRGDLFYDESVQKVLASHLGEFTDKVKYPRTYHLPWSPGLTNDDRMHRSTAQWENEEVVILEKLDGENTSLYRDYIHARSIDSRNHPSRARVKAIWGRVCGDIPEGWRFVLENMYATHSIHYTDLEDYAYGLSIWTDRNICLSYDTTVEWFNLLDIPTPKVWYRGIYDEKLIKSLWKDSMWSTSEGYVLRSTKQFAYSEFKTYVGKFVRKGHVMTAKHWMMGQDIVPNELKNE